MSIRMTRAQYREARKQGGSGHDDPIQLFSFIRRKKTDPRIEPVTFDARPRRNKPCPCGSELKYKDCCLATGLQDSIDITLAERDARVQAAKGQTHAPISPFAMPEEEAPTNDASVAA